METNRRLATRHNTLGLMSNVFDGRSAVLGVVEDISRTGLRVSNIPSSFKDSVETCYMVVNGPRNDFYLVLQPRWSHSTNRGMYKMMGFQIQDPPVEWEKFLSCVEGTREESDPFTAMVSCEDIEM